MEEQTRLTQHSKGAGCGCKIPSAQLDIILKDNESRTNFKDLLVGNNSRDDAAVMDLGNGMALISTTDFFTPIVDDAFDFGRIASVNAINDIYAMGGKPILAIAILGWDIDKLPAKLAQKVIHGSRTVCEQAGIPLAGGHSIKITEPIFGLAVNGLVPIANLKQNSTAKEGDLLFLTKPLGIGIITTAVKRGIVKEEDYNIALELMLRPNSAGMAFGNLPGVTAMTDVTGFGFLGHLIEMAEGSNLSAEVDYNDIPRINNLENYISQACYPGNTTKNWAGYEHKVHGIEGNSLMTLCDPQTSGGLLVAVRPDCVDTFREVMKQEGLGDFAEKPVGKLLAKRDFIVFVNH